MGKHIETLFKDHVFTITLNRPPLNILNVEMMDELSGVLFQADSEETKLIVLTATGKAFCAGVDVSEHRGDLAKKMIASFHRIFRVMEEIRSPILAAVNGIALGGGCELAIACDMIVASERAKFGQPEIKVGVLPPIAAIMIHGIISLKRGYEFLLSGDPLSAEEAWHAGFINKVVKADLFEEELQNFVKRFSSLSLPVLRLTKKSIKASQRRSFSDALSEVEMIYLQELMKTEDAEEGLRAFLEKRDPRWKNR
ncbi:MAG: enoyl-CoA hydratase-related protein [Acidobacteriota bacterium]